MDKTDLKKIMYRHTIVNCEVEDVIYFVHDLLEFQADELKVTEPYAENTIASLRNAAYEVYNLFEYIEAAMADIIAENTEELQR